MTHTLKKGKHYKTPICYKCDHDKFPGGKMITKDDKLATYNTKSGQWTCGVCAAEQTRKSVALFGRLKNNGN